MFVRNGWDGLADETTVTTGNSGGSSGTAFNTVTIGTTGVVVADSARAVRGGRSCRISTGGTSANAHMGYTTAIGSTTTIRNRIYVWFDANPAATVRVLQLLGSAGATSLAGISITNLGKLRSTNAASATIQTSTASIATGQWVMIETQFILSATVGQIITAFYNTPGAAATETLTSTATQNLGSVAADSYRQGLTGAAANVAAFWIDEVAWSDGGVIGPAVIDGAADLALSAALAAAGTAEAHGTAALALASTLTGAGRAEQDGAAALGVAVALAGAGRAEQDAAGALALSVALAAAGRAEQDAAADLQAAVVLAAGGRAEQSGAAQLAAVVDLDAQGDTAGPVVVTGSAALVFDLAITIVAANTGTVRRSATATARRVAGGTVRRTATATPRRT